MTCTLHCSPHSVSPMSVFIQRSSSLSNVSGTKWYEVPIVIVVGHLSPAYFVSWRTGVSLSPEQAEDEFQVEFHDTRVRTDRT